MVLEGTDTNFEELVLKSDKPVLVDFWATWCGPCRMIGPIVDELSEDYADKVVMVKIDIDNHSKVAQEYSVRNIPTILFFKNGEKVDKQVGAVSKSVLAKKIDALL